MFQAATTQQYTQRLGREIRVRLAINSNTIPTRKTSCGKRPGALYKRLLWKYLGMGSSLS